MPMSPFVSRFPELGADETTGLDRRQHEGIPPGEYAFLERYCDEKGCDCRRVLIQVLEKDSGPKVWASINFGWESTEFYQKWMRSRALAEEASGSCLDPILPQTRYANALLDYFNEFVEDPVYLNRLKHHYSMFKARRERPRSSSPNRPRLGVKRSRKNPR